MNSTYDDTRFKEIKKRFFTPSPILSLSEENRSINHVDLEHDDSIEKATDELNTKFRPELQDKIDSIQNHETAEKLDTGEEFRIKNSLKTVQAGINTGNVNITWEADQKCIKPKVTVNEKATREEISEAVANAEFAFYLSCQTISSAGDIAAPLPISEPKSKHSKKNMEDLSE